MTTVGQVLGGGAPADLLGEELQRGLAGVAELARLAGTVSPAQIVHALAGVLDMPMGHIALVCWSRDQEVREARERTKTVAGQVVIKLTEHVLSSEQNPVVEIVASGVRREVLRLTLELELKVASALLVVAGGEVVSVRHGHCQATARLAASNITVKEKTFTVGDLTDGLRLPVASPSSGESTPADPG